MTMGEKGISNLEVLDVPPFSVAVVAVSGSRKGRHAVKWAVEKFVPEGTLCFKLLHVRPIIARIPTPMGNYIPISQVREDVAEAFRKDVELQANEKLLPCKKLCDQRKARVEIVQIESDDVVSAIAEYIVKHDMNKLIIGASSRTAFSRGRSLSSKISEACPSSCTVFVVSKGKLSSLRPADSETNGSFKDCSSDASCSTDDSSSQAMSSRTVSMDLSSMESFSSLRPALLQLQQFQALSALNQTLLHKRMPSSESLEFSNSSHIDEDCDVTKDSQTICLTTSAEDDSSSFQALTPVTSIKGQVDVDFELEKMRIQLRHIRGIYATTQGEAIEASRKLETHGQVTSLRLKKRSYFLSEGVVSSRLAFGLGNELNELQKRRMEDEIIFKQISSREDEARAFATQEKERYEAAKEEAEIIKQCAEIEARARREAEIRAARETREKKSLESALDGSFPRYRQFKWEEIVSATSSFSDALKIGMGAYGTVYKCNFQHTTAAVKVFHSKEASKNKQFRQELEILSEVHHPNLLILLGACPDHGCLAYEYMENGSLEDRLMRKNNTPPLPWFDRFKIAWEVASTLVFLHHSKPNAIIHRDLKPANILLDRNNVSKIGDVGLSVIVNKDSPSSSIALNDAAPVGTLCYIDPEYQRTGIVSPKSDVYALGMVFLQLLTAKPAIALAHTMEVAVENDHLIEVLDQEAGSWPVQETKDFAALALKCIEWRRTDRPDLQDEVLPFLEKMKELAEKARISAVTSSKLSPPKHFICPILQEIMTDPCVVADGYTYDRKAIETWVKEKDTSPTTGLPLPHKGLIPNYALLSAIIEWKSGKMI